jgi:hypothetical protein
MSRCLTILLACVLSSAGVSAASAQQSRLIKYPLIRLQKTPESPLQRRTHGSELKDRIKANSNYDIRAKAYESLQRLREAQKITHRNAGFCQVKKDEPIERSCRPQAGPNGPGGDGTGGSGGPGMPGQSMNGCAWTSIGPTDINGRVTSISIDPSNKQRIFLTTVGGIWRSFDTGRSWERVSDDFLATVFASIVVNGNEVVAGGGDPNYGGAGNGIWRSTSSGDPGSWTKMSGTSFDNQTIYRLRVDPANGDVYAATSNGVWIGTHSGGSLTFARLDGFDAGTNDIAIDFSVSPRTVYAGVISASATYDLGIWKHSGAGPWQSRDTGIPTGSIQRIALALAASSPNTLYAKISRNTDGRLLGVFKTTTGGEAPMSGNAWQSLPGAAVMDDSTFPPPGSNGYSWYNSVIEVDPTDPSRVYAGGLNIYRSTDGANFSSIDNGTDPAWSYGPHSDQHAIAFDPTNPKIIWLGNDGGLDRTTDTSASTWRWLDVSHGMVVTQFYRLTSQQGMTSLRAGGSQDNGTEATFGNRTWYQFGGCDGATVAVDGVDPDTIFGNCNGGLAEFVNPVPGWQGGPTTVSWTSSVPPVDPLVSDPALAMAALAQGAAPTDSNGNRTGPPILLETTDGRTWTQANSSQPFTINQSITTIAIAPSSSFQTWYVGVSGGGSPIWVTTNGGGAWNTATTGLPTQAPARIVVDAPNANRAFAAFNSGVWMTTNGTDWRPINGSGGTAFPAGASAQSLVIDPNDAHTLYVATNIGVLRGTISGSPADAAWTTMDDGLPDGLNVTDIWVGRSSGLLTISSFGYGAYQLDIRPDITCPTQILLVRDNVYDRGDNASPSGLPDPEHPIPDPSRPGFFMPDNTDAGKVYWWSSPDIRVDVPSLDPPANTIANADNVEMQTCPIEMSACPPGTIWDNHPVRNQLARVYTQVSNQGIDPVTNVRVIALFADATAGLPLLPSDFWTTTFPAGSTSCGPLTAGSGWHLADPAHPCKTIAVVNPIYPETVSFDWQVPAGEAEHTCMLVIVESTDDPVETSIRASNERRLWVLVPNSRHIANRNLHVVDAGSSPSGGSGVSGMGLPWPADSRGPIILSISQSGMPPNGQVGLLLPSGVKPEGADLVSEKLELPALQAEDAKRLGVVPDVAWMLPKGTRQVRLGGLVARPGEQAKLALYWTVRGVPPASTWRITTLARDGNAIIGGSIFYLRIK